MTIEQLIYFTAIVEKKTFSQAAYALHISQSSLSKQIMKLESELGVALFDRTKRQIKLTPVAMSIYEDMQAILKSHAHILNQIQSYQVVNGKEIKIAMLPIFSQYDITEKIEAFSKLHQDIIIQNIEMEERDIESMLSENQMDLYFLRGEYELENFIRFRVGEDELVAVVSSSSPFGKREEVSLKELKEEAFLLFPTYTMIRKISEDACRQAGFTPKVKRYGRLHTLLAAAGNQEGIVLSMRHSLQQYQLEGLNVMEIKEGIKSYIYMYISKDSLNKQGVRKLIDYFRVHTQ